MSTTQVLQSTSLFVPLGTSLIAPPYVHGRSDAGITTWTAEGSPEWAAPGVPPRATVAFGAKPGPLPLGMQQRSYECSWVGRESSPPRDWAEIDAETAARRNEFAARQARFDRLLRQAPLWARTFALVERLQTHWATTSNDGLAFFPTVASLAWFGGIYLAGRSGSMELFGAAVMGGLALIIISTALMMSEWYARCGERFAESVCHEESPAVAYLWFRHLQSMIAFGCAPEQIFDHIDKGSARGYLPHGPEATAAMTKLGDNILGVLTAYPLPRMEASRIAFVTTRTYLLEKRSEAMMP